MKTKSFWVIGSGALSQDDLSTLALLYQPLLATNAYGLYMVFNHLLDCKTYQSDIYTTRFLMDLLNLKEKELAAAFDKLEAIGLMSTYLKDDLFNKLHDKDVFMAYFARATLTFETPSKIANFMTKTHNIDIKKTGVF
ncbi:MAG: hypothetical protein CVV63_05250, partial [Tenericutes bacterium HGW-Tenericutes-8]